MFYRPSPLQAGSALVVTMLTVIAVVAMLSLGSERMFAARVMTQLSADRSRALSAAETVSALIESKLFQVAADPAKLSENLDLDRGYWWNLRGFEPNSSGKIDTALYLDGCAIRWRVEPVKIMSNTLDSSGQYNLTGKFTVNSQIDPNLQSERKDQAGEGLYDIDAGYYHYRIVTEAFALKDPSSVTTIPWDNPGTYTTSAQAQRVLQLKNVNIFKYVIFYAATGPTGDIEFHNGPDLEIQGAVHSNAAIYLGGNGSLYMNGDYVGSASSGGKITVGKKDAPVNVTGVDGIFRLRKQANLRMASVAPDASLFNPYQVPLPNRKTQAGIEMSGSNNLNGGLANSSTVTLNGVNFVYTNDSRSALSDPYGLTHSDKYIFDGKNRKAQVVRTISNFSSFAGYPLESRREVGPGVRLRVFNSGANSGQFTTQISPETAVHSSNAFASELPLFQFSNVSSDIWPQQPSATSAAANYPITNLPISGLSTNVSPWAINGIEQTSYTYLPILPNYNGTNFPFQVLPDYFKWSILGRDPSPSTGLTIRERGMQNFRWLNDAAAAGLLPASYVSTQWITAPPRTSFASDLDWVTAYAEWMKSNYVVYLGKSNGVPVDITNAFFNFRPNTLAQNLTDLPAREEDQILADTRARRWESDNGDSSPSNSNVLTLNIGLIMDFLRTQNLNLIAPEYASQPNNVPANTVFNGLLYVHRSHRYETVANNQAISGRNFAHPLKTCGFHPFVTSRPPGYATFNVNNIRTRYPTVGMVGQAPAAIATGTPGSWTMYHSTRSVRLHNATNINHGGVQTAFSNRRSGLTIVTPNQCYIWGDFNTVIPADNKITPCAVFADSVTALSGAWVDSGPLTSSRPAASSTILNTSLVINNLPSDAQNISDAGSGGVHNVIRLLENWENPIKSFTFRGSLVVLNRMRYSRATLNHGGSYKAPNRLYDFNEDLLTTAGQPPFSPMGPVPTRVVSTVSLLDN
jgi:hypothetical protein